jgi:hypothetical protein
MRFDRQDIFPLSVVLLFGLVIPLALWLGFGTRQQISHDLYGAAKTLAVVSAGIAALVGCLSIIARRREKRILAERGEQYSADFVAQFTTQSERRAANIVFDTLWQLSTMKRMPRLERGDQISGQPLFLAQGDLEERMETLFEELGFSLWLDLTARRPCTTQKLLSNWCWRWPISWSSRGRTRFSSPVPIASCRNIAITLISPMTGV